jgi:hypothetical protein
MNCNAGPHAPSGIDIGRERLIRLSAVRDHLPPNPRGQKQHRSAAFRWAGQGLRGHRLEFIQLGGVRYTSTEALQRFFDRLTAAGANPRGRQL